MLVAMVDASFFYQPFVLAALIFYLLVVRSLRYRRRDALQKQYNYPNRKSFAKMTIEDAHLIQLSLAELEFPTTFSKSVFFALFKVSNLRSI